MIGNMFSKEVNGRIPEVVQLLSDRVLEVETSLTMLTAKILATDPALLKNEVTVEQSPDKPDQAVNNHTPDPERVKAELDARRKAFKAKLQGRIDENSLTVTPQTSQAEAVETARQALQAAFEEDKLTKDNLGLAA